MVATYVLALSLVGSVLSDALLPAVVVNGVRVAPNNGPSGSFQGAPLRSFGSAPSPSAFRSQPVFTSVPASPAFAPQPAPFRSFQPSPAFAPQPAPFRSFQPSPAFAPAPAPFRSFQPSPAFAPASSSRFQSDFAAPAQPSFAAPQTPFAAPPQTAFGAGSPQSFRIQEDFTSSTGPVQPIPTATVTHRVHQQDESGSYSSQFQTSDGQSVSEVGTAKATPDGLDTVVSKSGFYSYTSPEGTPVAVSYVADEQGFRVNSPNLPQNIAQ